MAPTLADREEFLALVRQSRSLHRPWVYVRATREGFTDYLRKLAADENEGFFVRRRDTGAIAGVFELSVITRGPLQSAYVGFYAMAPSTGHGYMEEGLRLVLRHAFRTLGLHRVEAAIQPANARSIALVRRCGFRLEGFSPRYLKIGGRWRDHQRWALLADEWRSRAAKR